MLPTPRCSASSTTPGTRRRSRTISSCWPAPACSRACPSSRATRCASRGVEPQAPGPQHGAVRPRSRAARSPTRGPTASFGGDSSNRRSARTWPTPPRWATVSCPTGATATARSTSSLRGAGGLAAIEVKSGRAGPSQPGIAALMAAFGGLRLDPAAPRGWRRDPPRALPARAGGALGRAVGHVVAGPSAAGSFGATEPRWLALPTPRRVGSVNSRVLARSYPFARSERLGPRGPIGRPRRANRRPVARSSAGTLAVTEQ